MRSGRTSIWVCALFVLGVAAFSLWSEPARADEMSRLYSQILRDPLNVQLNLRYAELAEDRGEIRKALAAYERVLDADPGNSKAQSGLNSITAELTPAITSGRLELGVRYETNVLEVPTGEQDDVAGFANLYVSDERTALGRRWRSDASLYADIHGDVSRIDYWYGRVHTGPVFDLGGGTTLHVAPSGAVSFLDADYFYSEGAVRLLFEQLMGFLDRFEIRGGYRDIDNSFSRTEGFVLDVIAQEVFHGLIIPSDAFVVQPFFRWRDASGSGNNAALPTSFLMGDYIEAGGRLMYFFYVADDVRLGGRFTFHRRDYKQDVTFGTEDRFDWYISPEAELLFRDVVCSGCAIRLRYRYEQNLTNDPTQKFINHSIIASGIRSF